ncbi:MAG: hypothetical protein ACR2LR_19270 [Hassallia sp.]
MSGFDTFYIVPSFAQPLASCSVFMVGGVGDREWWTKVRSPKLCPQS